MVVRVVRWLLRRSGFWFAALAVAGCAGNASTSDEVTEVTTEALNSDEGMRRIATPANVAPCADEHQQDWRADDWGYNARVTYCADRAGRLGYSMCTVRACADALPAKTCTEGDFVGCWLALTFKMDERAIKPTACEVCF
jgi:hypothetical protein